MAAWHSLLCPLNRGDLRSEYVNITATRVSANQLTLIFAALGAGLAASLFYTPLPFIAVIGVPLAIYFANRPYELLLFMVFLIPFNFVFKVGPVPVAAELLKVVIWIPFIAT